MISPAPSGMLWPRERTRTSKAPAERGRRLDYMQLRHAKQARFSKLMEIMPAVRRVEYMGALIYPIRMAESQYGPA